MTDHNPEPLIPNSDVILKTPSGIKLYRLASIKGRIKLEKEGLKFRVNTRSQVAREFGLKPRDSHDKFLEKIQTQIDAVKADILKESLILDNVSPDITRVISCDRAAIISQEFSAMDKTWRVMFDTTTAADRTKRPPEFHDSADDALAAAKSWVLEVR